MDTPPEGPGYPRPVRPRLAAAALLLLLAPAWWAPPSAAAQEADLEAWIEALGDPDKRADVAFRPPEVSPDSRLALRILLSALDDSDRHVRAYVAAAMGDIGFTSETAIVRLISLFQDEDELVQGHATVAAGKLGPPAVPLLLEVLAHENAAEGRPGPTSECELAEGPAALAAIALGLLGAAAAGEVLDRVPDLEPERRFLARFALAEMGIPAAEDLQAGLRNANPDVREVSVQAVSDLGASLAGVAAGSPELANALGELLADFRSSVRAAAGQALAHAAAGVAAEHRPRLARTLAGVLEDREAAGAHRSALEALTVLGPDAGAAVPAIVPLVQARDRDIARAAVLALGRVGAGEPAAMTALERLVRRGPDHLRAEAASSLAELGRPGLSVLLEVALDDGAPPNARAAAMDALQNAAAQDPSIRRWLARSVRDISRLRDHRSREVRGSAAGVLGVIGGAEDREALTAALADGDRRVWEPALRAAEAAGPEARTLLLATAEVERRRGILGRVPGVDPRPDRDRTAAALRSLGRMGAVDEDVLGRLRDGLQDDDPEVRMGAVHGIGGLRRGARALVPDLLELMPATESEDRISILEALTAISPPDPEAVPILTDWLREGDELQRVAAAQLLTAMGPRALAAMPALREALRDPNPHVAFFAGHATAAADPEGAPDTGILAVLYDGAVLRLVADARQRVRTLAGCPSLVPVYRRLEVRPLPEFPWPPPMASHHHLVPRELVGEDSESLGEIHARLRAAIHDAGFRETPLFEVPGGFAIVTLVERIQDNGVSYPVPDRWNAGKLPPGSIREYLTHLFFGPPGRFRMIVLAVTTDPVMGVGGDDPITEEDARRLTEGAGLVLPPEIAEQPFEGRHVLALVYHFQRQVGATSILHRPDEIGPEEHLRGAGIMDRLEANPRGGR